MKIWLLTCFACCASVSTVPADSVPVEETISSLESWDLGSLRLGVRLGRADLQKGDALAPGAPAGQSWRLDEDPDAVPALHAQYTLCPHDYGGIGLGVERFAVSVSNPTDGGAGAVGDLVAWAPKMYVFSHFPNETSFTPFGEVGVAYFFTEFDAESGAPLGRLDVDDTGAWFIDLGCRADLTDHWSAELAWRRLFDADVDAHTPGGVTILSLDHDLLTAGLSWRF